MTSIYATDVEVARIAHGVRDRTLPKPEWTHAAHFAAALWLLRDRPLVAVVAGMPDLIRAYNEATDTPNTDAGGYHHTITLASLGAAHEFLGRYPRDHPLHGIVDDLMTSPLGSPGWLLDYWSKGRLFSVEARRDWAEPDLQHFPHAV
ncbi:hypothetical protein JKL49_14795 [Phenylobacterium sp. 20VBR1]|uniref:Uncharacterized protein n=1 Tax=Phenylobacterium glaciei TaxID=2803784 RepID=A0A941HX95_9CAUL|nr:hypothetical protein [Phenylobacterium glaciei]MBR7620658.1 hypothetical protein [Phenylobacterium glaciei]